MKKIILFCWPLLAGFSAFAQLNITFKSQMAMSNRLPLSNIGGFVDSSGNEYALVGNNDGLEIIDVTDPALPVSKFLIPGNNSNWREVKTWAGHAYITTEACCNGLQIADLRYLPDSVSYKDWGGDGAISGQLETIHALHIDEGYAYLYGSNLFNGAAVIIDLADPWNPTYQGHTFNSGSNFDSYIHDGYVRNDTLWGGYIYGGYVGVVDVSNKTAPVTITTQNTPNNFTHNTWLSQDGRTLFTTDETADSYLTSYDVSNVNNITELDRIQSNPGSDVIVHNTHIVNVNGNDFAVTSWYKDGVVITDVGRPQNMVNVGYYDTYTQGSGNGFDGDWGVYPFLPSGNLVCSDMTNGLYVLAPTYVRACYLEGLVTDSASGVPLNNVLVEILGVNVTENTSLTGEYKTGYPTAGTYDVQFSKPGYYTKIISGVTLINSIVNILNVELVSLATVSINGQVTVAGSGTAIVNANVYMTDGTFDYNLTTDGQGNFSVSNIYPGTYDLYVGEWGYITYCNSGMVINGSTGPINVQLAQGIYDDFTFDYAWTVSGPSPNAWERDAPIGTTSGGFVANPGNENGTDCGDLCYVTDNGGGGGWDNDVDYGNTTLNSPVFDPTVLYSNPVLNYSRWFANLGNNGSGFPDDSMTVRITNGTTTVILETILHGDPTNSTWVDKNYVISNYLPITSTMQMIIETADFGPTFNVVEGGLDKFQITEGPQGMEESSQNTVLLQAFPNPFNGNMKLHYKLSSAAGNSQLVITDVTGRVVEVQQLNSAEGTITSGGQLSAGVYMARIIQNEKESQILKVIKTK